jgi:plastocyanin
VQAFEPQPDNPIIAGQSRHKLPKRKWVIIGILTLIVLAIALVILREVFKPVVTTPPVAISPVVAQVDVTTSGYKPSSIKIKKGQQITFTNQDTKAHRLFADQDMIPGFDSIEFLSQGDSYTYIFVNSGNFKYYDPDAPQQYVGNVTVE